MPATLSLPADVESFLSQEPLPMHIAGKWVAAASGQTFDAVDPGTGDVIAKVAAGDARDVDLAVQAARTAFRKSGWATMPPNDRAVILHRLADLIDKNIETVAHIESLDVGKPLPQARGDIGNVASTLRWYADFSVHVRYREPIAVSGFEARQIRVPYGVAAFILPWNFPLLLVGWNAAPALAAGNCIVIKPAEDTSLSTLYFAKLAQEAGIPDGVVNVITGMGESVGKPLAEHRGINRMGFTGSPEVGRAIAAACGANLVPVKCELGGKGAAVIFDDVDPDDVADKLVGAVTLNTGQVCCTATRWVIHEKLWDKVAEAARAKMTAIDVGHGLEGHQMGPAVSEKQRKRILGYLEKGRAEGARFVLEGGKASVADHPGGFYVKPALLAGDPDNVACRDEIFGPVAFLLKFKDEQEAVDLVNRSDYGLANSVWSRDLDRANRVAEQMVAGNSWINAHNLFPHGVPYGGVNRSGFGGGVNGPDTFFDYLRPQSIVRPLD